MQKYFEVSAEHMRKTGMPAVARVYPVLNVETNMIGGRGFDAFIDLDTSGDAELQQVSPGATWCVAAARGRFVDAPAVEEKFECIASYWTDGEPSRGIGKNAGRRTALGYFVNKAPVMSFPAHLNNYRAPDLDDVADILAGVSIERAAHDAALLADTVERMNADCLDWLPHPANPAFILVAHDCGIYAMRGTGDHCKLAGCERVGDSWMDAARLAETNSAIAASVELADALATVHKLDDAPRVNLAKPDAPEQRRAPVVVSCESNAVVMARAVETVRARRLAGCAA